MCQYFKTYLYNFVDVSCLVTRPKNISRSIAKENSFVSTLHYVPTEQNDKENGKTL